MQFRRSLALALAGLPFAALPAQAAYGPFEAPAFIAMVAMMLAGLAAPFVWWRGRATSRRAAGTVAVLERRIEVLQDRFDTWPDGGIRLEGGDARAFGALVEHLGAGGEAARPIGELLLPLSPAARARPARGRPANGARTCLPASCCATRRWPAAMRSSRWMTVRPAFSPSTT